MILKYISLYLNPDEYSVEQGMLFDFRARYLCNYLERKLKALRFQTIGFNNICIQGSHLSVDVCVIVPENAVASFVQFDWTRFQTLTRDEHHEFIIDMLSAGLRQVASQHLIPIEKLGNAIDDFRVGNYKNEWVHQTKLLRPVGLHASLLCRLTPEQFVLTLMLEIKGVTIYRKEILETKPDELIFAYRFKEVVLDGDSVVVKSKFGDPTFSIALSALPKALD